MDSTPRSLSRRSFASSPGSVRAGVAAEATKVDRIESSRSQADQHKDYFFCVGSPDLKVDDAHSINSIENTNSECKMNLPSSSTRAAAFTHQAPATPRTATPRTEPTAVKPPPSASPEAFHRVEWKPPLASPEPGAPSTPRVESRYDCHTAAVALTTSRALPAGLSFA